MAFSSQTIARLVTALKGFIPASTCVLILSGLSSGGAAIGGATLAFMGLALGVLVGVPVGRWLVPRNLEEGDRRLTLVLALVFLPPAVLPAQPGIIGVELFGFYGWASILAGVAVALPLGVATGCTWSLLGQDPAPGRRSGLRWGAAGIGLGILVGAGAALVLSSFKGAFLVNVFAAPLVWPILPTHGNRTLLVRMTLTLVVVLSSMFLLFL